jgi:hypothetical protein
MPKHRLSTDNSAQMLSVLQDLFILQALQAGLNVEYIRKHLKVDIYRVSNLSKQIKKASKK